MQQDLDQTTIPKWGAKLSTPHGSNSGNPALGIEPDFICIQHITTDLYVINYCLLTLIQILNLNPNSHPHPHFGIVVWVHA